MLVLASVTGVNSNSPEHARTGVYLDGECSRLAGEGKELFSNGEGGRWWLGEAGDTDAIWCRVAGEADFLEAGGGKIESAPMASGRARSCREGSGRHASTRQGLLDRAWPATPRP